MWRLLHMASCKFVASAGFSADLVSSSRMFAHRIPVVQAALRKLQLLKLDSHSDRPQMAESTNREWRQKAVARRNRPTAQDGS